jgi:O-antigen/teichoic acid export membrane protein
MSENKSVLSKGILVVVFNISGMGIRFLSNLVLAWLLVPEMFGVAAIITTVIIGMMMLSDVGIYDSVIRNEKGERKDFCSTAWYMQLGRGVMLYLIILVIAPLLADFYKVPELKSYLYVSGIALILFSFKSMYMSILQRRIDVMPELKLEFIAQVVTASATVLIAYLTGSIWALVFSHVINGATLAIGSHFFTPRSFYRFEFVKEYFWEIVHFGKWIYFGTLATFLIEHVDKLILGRIGTLAELGVYQIGFTFAAIFYTASGILMGRLVYPALSEASRQGDEHFHRTMTDLKRVLLPLIGSLLLFSYFAAPYFFTYLYPKAYHDAGWISQYMLVMIWFMVLSDFHSSVFIAHNEPKVTAKVSLSVVFVRVLFSLVGYYLFDLVGFILGMALGSMIGYITYKYLLWKKQGYSNYYEVLVSLIGVVFLALFFIGQGVFVHTEFGRVTYAALSVAVMGAGLLIYYKKVIGKDRLAFA